ncbi:hypothetical protein CLCR_04416 [Cladophialophora carrionii]|uniref:Uncharacterized protein n=1 Tax=Cladophialophora carrionii TaxID=86049 RepID=A0A1C1CJA3_9EURO|nr:hypothetical protein CLCR_04416 [Cladophialophora carrionii]
MDDLAVTLVVSLHLRAWEEILKYLSKVVVILVELVVMTLMVVQIVVWPYYKIRLWILLSWVVQGFALWWYCHVRGVSLWEMLVDWVDEEFGPLDDDRARRDE